MAIITLLTDFGTQDEYVGVMKGIIVSINPEVTIIDLTHGLAPQNVAGAAYTLKAAYSFFPQGSIHVAVVDPGVGTRRQIVAVRCLGHIFLAPDNGLLYPIVKEQPPEEGYRVENQNLFHHPVSRTFHGRDVFAPVAAHLSRGMPLKALGTPMDVGRLQQLNTREPAMDDSGTLVGQIVTVDRFGNLITNISVHHLSALGSAKHDIYVGDQMISGMVNSYAQRAPGELLAIIGSRNCLEIAVNGGSACKRLNLAIGGIVRVKALK